MRYEKVDPDLPTRSSRPSAVVLGAREGTGNIGDEVVNELAWCYDYNVVGDDCAMSDGSRPPGGNIPDDETAREHGYTVTDKGRYQWFDAPSVDFFKNIDAEALIITLGATYKGHFADIPAREITRILNANLLLPLEAARRYVQAAESNDADRHAKAKAAGMVKSHDVIRRIVFVGSYAHSHPFTNGTLYCAAKAGIDMAAKTLGWELTDRGYRVHVVHPFHVQGTPMWEQVEKDVMKSKNMTWEEADAYNRKDLKMPDLLTASEVASVIGQLVTNDSLQWTSGTSIELFGGSR